MNKFEFKDRTITLDIAGEKFEIKADSEFSRSMSRLQKEAAVMSRELKGGSKTYEDALKLCTTILDDVLGTGAVKRIFKKRKITVEDCADILFFIENEIREVNKEIPKA